MFKRAISTLGVAGAITAAVVGGAAQASASTIPNGNIQICAQGSYPAYIHVLPAPIPNSGGATTGTFESFVQSPGNCWMHSFDSDGQTVQVDVVGLHGNGSEFYIRSYWWNSQTGLGIGAEGSEWSPWTEQW
jgi:hypothetical protein